MQRDTERVRVYVTGLWTRRSARTGREYLGGELKRTSSAAAELRDLLASSDVTRLVFQVFRETPQTETDPAFRLSVVPHRELSDTHAGSS